MNEAETRAELIDPRLKERGWGVVEGSKILREYHITAGKIQTGGGRAKPLIADYVLVRINPKEIGKKGGVPTNGSIFFTIFQTFMSGPDNQPYFGEYPSDYFDFIIIDECHRGGANDEGNWRGIMEYFSPAVQLGLTATPKRKDNADTYKYFGEPVYIYSLKEGINDGFLTPFKVKRIKTTLDDYVCTSDDQIIEGEIEEGKIYTEPDFNKIIEIKEREARRVQIFLSEINQNEKAIVFCATQDHALAVRDLVNQFKKSKEPNYCARVTANDGALGEQYLREFQDNEKTIPTILTTSQKLPELLTLKYHALDDAKEMLGSVQNIRAIFIDFQKYLYERKTA